ncbi:MAG: dihydroxyacetone kinase phosphoryl donor subunit DhaM, partial [Actinomycetota bacterium]
MVGIVLVSHSRALAEGAAELARQMGGAEVAIEPAGGLADGAIGTDAVRVAEAIGRAWSEDGVLVLMDLGSAILSAEMALEFVEPRRRGRVLLAPAPIVEGAVSAAVAARAGSPLADVAAEAAGGLAGKLAHLGGTAPAGTGEAARAPEGSAADGEVRARVVVDIPHGLHARPAARSAHEERGGPRVEPGRGVDDEPRAPPRPSQRVPAPRGGR